MLLICDEIQTGLGRTGKLLGVRARRREARRRHPRQGAGRRTAAGVGVRRAPTNVMQVFRPGDHGSTFGGNPLAAAVALAALDVLFDEGLIERSRGAGRASARASCARSRAR